MPPLFTSLRPGNGVAGNGVAGPLLDKNVLDPGALLEGGMGGGLGNNRLSTSLTLIRCDQNAGLAILDAVTKRLGGETSEDDGEDGTDSAQARKMATTCQVIGM